MNGQIAVRYHDFRTSLALSIGKSEDERARRDAAWWSFYKGVWPTLKGWQDHADDKKWQDVGIDRTLFLETGWKDLRPVHVDEKWRETTYDDFLCEEWSKYECRKPGWSVDAHKRCHFVAYAIHKIGKCYLLPFELLRLACEKNLPCWKKKDIRYPRIAHNKDKRTGSTWDTWNCAVSWIDLFDAMNEQMRRGFDFN